ARLKEQRLRSYASPEGGFALFGGWTGIDLSHFKDADVLTRFDSEGIKAAARWFTALDPERPATLAQAREEMKLASLIPLVTGDPIQVADEIERWIDDAGVDGLNLVPIYQPGSFTDFVELVVPELQRRGRVRKSFDGVTLREHLFGPGHRYMMPDHPGWKLAGIDPLSRQGAA
ncbi:MAG: 5,10-methylene tetrahydromethanopterin reductase, partial [Candidatus Binataceae bacterium]